MGSAAKELTDINKLLEEVGGLKKDAEKLIEQANRDFAKLQSRIKNGETTGDEIKDFVIAKYGFLNEKLEGVYRDLQNRAQRSVGEFVLAVVRRELQRGCTGFGGRGYVAIETSLYLGVLNKGKMIFNCAKGSMVFPSENHVVYGSRSEKISVVAGGLSIRSLLGDAVEIALQLNKPLKTEGEDFLGGLGSGGKKELEIMIGDKEIKDWCGSSYYDGVVSKMAQALGCKF